MRVLIALSIAHAMLANKDKHQPLSLDDILKKYEHKEHDDHLEHFDADYLAHEGLNHLHNSVYDVHQKAADLLEDSMPTLEPVMHPDSPLTHHDRLSAVMEGLGKKPGDDLLDMAAAPEDDAVAPPPEPKEAAKAAVAAADDEAGFDVGKLVGKDTKEPKDPFDTKDAAAPKEDAPKDEKKDEAPVEAAAPADAAPAEPEAPKADAPADADAPKDDADASKDAPAADADAPPVKEEATEAKSAGVASDENAAKAQQLALIEKTMMVKMGKSLKMMALLHMLVKPIEKKLQAAMTHMPAEAQADAKEMVGHMANLDKLTGAALGLMAGVQKAAHGTDQDKKAALLQMIVGLAVIEKGVKENLLAMKPPAHAHAGAMTSKLHMLLEKMQSKVDAELADPARKDDPLVAIDEKMLATMKKAVKKSEALLMVGAIAIKKAKTAVERQRIKASIKGAMQKVMGQLKTDIHEFKHEAEVVHEQALEKAKEEEEAGKKEEGEPAEEPAEEPAPGSLDDKQSEGDLKGLLDKINGIAAGKDTANLRSH